MSIADNERIELLQTIALRCLGGSCFKLPGAGH